MNKKNGIALVILLLGSFAAQAGGYDEAISRAPKENPSIGRLLPFSEIPSEYQQGFNGNDLQGLLSVLQKNKQALGLVKDEFTPTADFNAATKALVSQMNKDGKFIFIKPSDWLSKPKYDADNQELTIRVDVKRLGNASESEVNGTIFSSEMKEDSTYIASNAYGKAIEVTRTSSKESGLGFVNLQNDRPYYITLPMKPEEARQSVDDVAVVFICMIANPPLLEYDGLLSPRIDFPYEAKQRYQVLRVKLTGIHVINKVTGKVLKKEL